MTRRRLKDPFVVAVPAKAVARTCLRPSDVDEEVLLAVGGTWAHCCAPTWRRGAASERAPSTRAAQSESAT